MRDPLRIAFLFLALAAASTALAQQSIVYTVEGWPARAPAGAFQWGVGVAPPLAAGATGGGSGKPAIYDSALAVPVGDATVAFAKAALSGEHLRSVLVEFPLRGAASQGSPAPFAVRLSDVLVTSVHASKSGDSGPGFAEVMLRASRIEIYSSQQDSKTGRTYPSAKAGFDSKTMKAF